MNITTSENGNIHIGLALAGAVTAGAFTAGVLDYLFNTLELWHEEYEKDKVNIPKPNVVIDVITGSSAGSIVAAVALLGLATKQIKTPKDANNRIQFNSINPEQNLLYHTWVNLGLSPNEKITDKLFSNTDLSTEKKVRSLLNVNFMDDLIRSIKIKVKNTTSDYNLPKYINPGMEILMTLSNLRGIPVDLGIVDNVADVGQVMSYHKAFGYFKYKKNDENPKTLALNINDEDQLDAFLACSRASGAFPIGLKSVRIKNITKDYVESNIRDVFDIKDLKVDDVDYPYEFLAVDGGMTNNEPIAEVQRILADFETKRIGEVTESKNPIILIDPFPSLKMSENKPYCIDNDAVSEILLPLYQTLKNQTLFKENDLMDLLDDESFKTMIWPTRRDENGVLQENAIASGALDGFGGFLDKDYRIHDYMLGMKNCQNFLRYYFCQKYEDAIQNPEKWGNEYADYFKFEDKYGNEKLPIIPDFRITKREEGQQSTKVFLPKIENYMAKFPAKTTEQVMLKELKKKIKSRVGKIVKILAADLKLGRTYRWLAVSISKRRMSNYVIETIEKGLANQGLLQDKDKEEETPAC